jgi:peroxiredoxin family protein
MRKKLKAIITSPTATRRMGDFICNFVAVVLGIILTFWGSDWITEHKKQNEVKDALSLVRSEILMNREHIEKMKEQEIFEKDGTHYLLKYKDNMKEASSDSLEKYGSFPFQITSYIYINDAMEMLKSSALLQNIRKKEIATQLIRAYSSMKEAYDAHADYENYKKEKSDRLFNNKEFLMSWQKEKVKSSSFKKTWEFIFKYPEGRDAIENIYNNHQNPGYIYDSYLQVVDQTIAVIDKEYN